MFNVLHQHTHTNLVPDPAVGLEPRADNDGPAIPLTCTRWDVNMMDLKTTEC